MSATVKERSRITKSIVESKVGGGGRKENNNTVSLHIYMCDLFVQIFRNFKILEVIFFCIAFRILLVKRLSI